MLLDRAEPGGAEMNVTELSIDDRRASDAREIRSQVAVVRMLADEVERILPGSDESLRGQLAMELMRLSHRILTLADELNVR